jgi:DNA-directed RNA polymerase specialized sigma24 family protein
MSPAVFLSIRLMVPTMNESVSPAGFPTTHWSRVAHAFDPAAPEARAALAELCGAYWYPIYAFIRRKGNDPEQALDLAQGYFAHLLERGSVAAADPVRGRFRSFLLADCRHFLAHQRERGAAARRGGQHVVLSINASDAEGQYQLEPPHDQTPERLFERVALKAQGKFDLAVAESRECIRLDPNFVGGHAELGILLCEQ